MGANSIRAEAEERRDDIAAIAPQFVPPDLEVERQAHLDSFDVSRGELFSEIEISEPDLETDDAVADVETAPVELETGPAPLSFAERERIRIDEDTARMHTTEEGRRLEGLALDLGRGTGEESVGAGLMARNNAGSAELSAAARREQRARARRDLAHVMAMLDDYLATIDNNIARIDRGLSAIDQLEAQLAAGTFDPSNPTDAQAILMEQAGLSSEDFEGRDAGDVLNERRGELQRDRSEWVSRREEVRELGARAEAGDPEAIEELNGIMSGEIGHDEHHAGFVVSQALDQVESIEAQERTVNGLDRSDEATDVFGAALGDDFFGGGFGASSPTEIADTAAIPVDEEVGAFLRELAEAERLGDRSAQQTLVEGLSDGAREVVASNDAHSHLFTDGYFDEVEQVAGEPSADTALPSSTPSPV